MYKRLLPLIAIAGFVAGAAPGAAQAESGIFLEDENSQFWWNFDELAFEDVWSVDGHDNLFAQKRFFGMGSEAAEISLSSFELLSLNQPNASSAVASFVGFDGKLGLNVIAMLDGGDEGSGVAQLQEIYTFTNLSSQADTLSFFYYEDFDIAGSDSFDDDVTAVRGNRLVQLDGSTVADEACVFDSPSTCSPNPAEQPEGAGWVVVEADQMPDHVQVGPYPQLLAQFFDGQKTVLNDDAGPLRDSDGTAAMQFDRSIGAGEVLTFRFSKRLERFSDLGTDDPGDGPGDGPDDPSQNVPEPAAALAVLGLGAYLLRTQRR